MHLKSTYILNILIIHHPNDQERCDELRNKLTALRKQNKGYIINKITFDGTDLTDTGRAMLKELLAAADVVLVLMSEVSILSPLFVTAEMRKAVEEHKQKKFVLFPIILDTCWWEDTMYKQLEVLPRAGLPIYDSPNIKEQLYEQILQEIQHQLDLIKQKKHDGEKNYNTILAEANELFDQWETKPDLLRKALPLYREVLAHWKEGFMPTKAVLEARIELCAREINFLHYSIAAKDAYKQGDIEGAFFSSKDALLLREDAIMRKLYEVVASKLHEDEMRLTREPYEQHINKGHEHFLSLQWEKAREQYVLALEFYEQGFVPKKEIVEHKIEICRREFVLENSLELSKQQFAIQDYSEVVETLMKAIREINREAFAQIDHVLQMMKNIEFAEPFFDQQSKKWGYFHCETKAVIIAPKYTAAFSFSEHLAGVKKWEKWGFIDIEGNEIIPFEYSFVGHFKDGIAEVVKDKEMFFINHKGEKVEKK